MPKKIVAEKSTPKKVSTGRKRYKDLLKESPSSSNAKILRLEKFIKVLIGHILKLEDEIEKLSKR